jgi:hypothetical protein
MSIYVLFIAALHAVPIMIASFIFYNRFFTSLVAIFMIFIAISYGSSRYNLIDCLAIVLIWWRLYSMEARDPDPVEETPPREKEGSGCGIVLAPIIIVALIFATSMKSTTDQSKEISATLQAKQFKSNNNISSPITPSHPIDARKAVIHQKQKPRFEKTTPKPHTAPNPTDLIQRNQEETLTEAPSNKTKNNEEPAKCEYKSVMTNIDYHNCGISPPQ